MKSDQYISNAVIRRLPRYYRYLGDLMADGEERISSVELSRRMGLTASQVRQDLNHFGDFGQQGYGYNVETLRLEIGKILGLEHEHSLIIIGAGHLGSAIANYSNFSRRGFCVKALFEQKAELIGTTVNSHPVLDIRNLEDYLAKNEIDIAVLTVPKSQAQQVANRLVSCGVKYFLNFAPLDLCFDDPEVIVESVHLSDSMMTLSYKIKNRK